MRNQSRVMRTAAAMLAATTMQWNAFAKDPAWSLDRPHRVLVRVDPDDLGSRDADVSVASFDIDFARYFDGRCDLASLVVVQYDPSTGLVVDTTGNAYADTPGELPIRFYDAKIPWSFPDYEG